MSYDSEKTRNRKVARPQPVKRERLTVSGFYRVRARVDSFFRKVRARSR